MSDSDSLQLKERLRRHVEVLAEVIGPRQTGKPANLEATRRYLNDQLREMGLEPATHKFNTLGREGENIEVVLQGSKATKPALVVGAHYYTVSTTPGADDNASAVAILLELLRSLVGKRLKRTLRGVFYDTEEPPYFNVGGMGSQEHARQCRQRGDRLLGMICLESLGYYKGGNERTAEVPPILRPLLRWIGHRSIVAAANPGSAVFLTRMMPRLWRWGGVPIRPIVAPRSVQVINLSDHRSYWDEGYAAVMLTDTALLRNPHYHEPTDRLETLDLESMTRLSAQITRAAGGLCG